MSNRAVFQWVVLGCAALAAACSAKSERPTPRDGGIVIDDGGPVVTCATGASVMCSGTMEMQCNEDGTVGRARDCSASGESCAPGVGCVTCVPNVRSCDGDVSRVCRADGTGFDTVQTCDPAAGESCNAASGLCSNPCADAAATNSYIGCEYWPTPTLNSQVAIEFEFAVVVSNPQTSAATVNVEHGGANVRTVTVAPGGIETLRLPWVTELKGVVAEESSQLVQGGAYHLTSNLPVTVYQFNALDYQINRDCADEQEADPLGGGDGQCFSYSNDASLLLPTHVLTGNYMIMSRPTMVNRILLTTESFLGGEPEEETIFQASPGFFAVIGAEDGVSVEIEFTANVRASSDGSVRGFRAGETGTFTLGRGDVLQIVSDWSETCAAGSPSDPEQCDPLGFQCQTVSYCTQSRDADLTGSIVRASGKVSVIGGHNCSFVPANRWACDHLEEGLFPAESWGKELVVSMTQPLRSEPNVVRILSATDGNALEFEPAVHAPVTLARGEFLEFEVSQDFIVRGSEPMLVGQFLVGQNYDGSVEEEGSGDPSLSLAIPSEQFRSQYSFLAPVNYKQSYVNIVAPEGAEITLDGANVSGFRPIGSTGLGSARVALSSDAANPATAAHEIHGSMPFGVVVYGFGSYTSYMYPAGLDLEQIAAPF